MLKSAKGPTLDAPAGREIVLSDDLAKIFIERGYAVSLEADVAEMAEVADEPEETTVPAKKATKKKA